MTVSIKSVLERVVGALEDEGSTTWTLQDLVRFANDGQDDMLTRRPDLFGHYVEHPLQEGWRQSLPADGTKLIDVLGNAAGDKRPCTLVKRTLLDAQVRGWRSADPALAVDHFMFDERDPRHFEVCPPAATGATLALEYVRRPAALSVPGENVKLAALAGDIAVPDEMHVALQHYIAFRAFAEGSEDGNVGTAEKHFSLYANALGVENQATKDVAPTTRK